MEDLLTNEFGERGQWWDVQVYVSNPEIPDRQPEREGIPGKPTGLLKAWYRDHTLNVHSLTFTNAADALAWLGRQKYKSEAPEY